MRDAAGRFIWHDVMTGDTKGAEAFYTAVIGWRATDSGMPEAPYTILHAGDDPVGGIMAIQPGDTGMPPCWTGYIGVADVDAMTDKVAARGGKVWKAPQDIPGVGRFSVVADPHGAAFILFKGSSEFGPVTRPMGTVGHIAWNELHANDREEALSWYCDLFGWKPAERNQMTPDFIYQTVAMGTEAANGGMMTRMHFEPWPYWAYYIWAGDIDAAAGRVTAHGGQVMMGPHEVPGGAWILAARDPQGAHFHLIGSKA